MNPGFANLLALVSAGICERVDKIVVTESVDATGYTSAATQQSVGFGHPITKPELPQMVERGTRVFGDAVAMMADALRLELDEIRCAPEFAVATEDMDLGFMKIDQGCVAGVKAAWHGVAHGRSAIELRVVWKMGKHMQPDWKLEHGYGVEIDGSPRVRTRLQILPPHGFEGKSFEDFMVLGMIATALPAVHAIPAVCAARPGIVSYAELPLVTAAHCVR
jgi:4-hydroxy-tetrahydrodipicolinate reductase